MGIGRVKEICLIFVLLVDFQALKLKVHTMATYKTKHSGKSIYRLITHKY